MNSNQDIIFIENFKLETIIGTESWEQQAPQTISLDLKLHTNITAAANSDDLRMTINYQQLHDQLLEFAKAEKTLLLETLATNIANFIFANFPTTKLWLKLAKPTALKQASNVGVIIERAKSAT